MLIRPIDRAADVPALQALWRAAWRDTYGPLLGPGRMHLIDEAVALPAVSAMVADDGGGLVSIVDDEVIGSVCFAERRGIGYVWGMYVHPERRRRGFGTALIRRAAHAMAGAETLQLSTVTPAAEGFYRQLGFRAKGVFDFEIFPSVVRPATSLVVEAAILRRASGPQG